MAGRSPVWFFLHVPKCAGKTFKYTLERNLYAERYLALDHRSGLERREAVDRRLSSMSGSELGKIDVVAGHGVYLGVDRYFDRPARYVTFVRNPADRLVSAYNHLRRRADKGLCERLPPFRQCLAGVDNELAGFLLSHCDRPVSGDIPGAVSMMLERFWFVGLVENFREDAFFLYDVMGMRRIYGTRNVTPRDYVREEFRDDAEYREMKEILLERLVYDAALYAQAQRMNARFRQEQPDFMARVEAAGRRVVEDGEG